MASDDTPNLPATTEPASGPEDGADDGRVIGGRAMLNDIYLIDRAALEVGKKRGPFVIDAAIAEARRVLAAKAQLGSPVPA